MRNKLTFKEFVITDSVFNQIKSNPELYDFQLVLALQIVSFMVPIKMNC